MKLNYYQPVLNWNVIGLERVLGPDADEERGAPPGGHGLPGEEPGLEDAGKRALELLDGSLDDLPEAVVGVLLVEEVDQLHHDLGVCVGLERVALRH